MAKFGVALILFVTTACQTSGSVAAQMGSLEGRITVRPLSPVERPVPAPVPPEVYTSRPLLIRQGGAIVARVTPDGQGHFRVALPPGRYTLINAPLASGRQERSDGPKPFVIEPGQTTIVGLVIDTGLR